jgi:hypothetical protein
MSRGFRLRPALTLGLALLTLVGCRSKRPAEGPEELLFAVDTTLLGPAYAVGDLGFSVRPPRGWTPVPDSLLGEAAARIASGRPSRPWAAPHLLAAYRRSPEGALFLVTRFPRPVSDAERDTLGDLERDALAAATPPETLREAVFLHRGVYVRQFLATDRDRVLFRLLVTPPGAVTMRLDYVVPQGLYPHVVKAIESSIGSVDYRP